MCFCSRDSHPRKYLGTADLSGYSVRDGDSEKGRIPTGNQGGKEWVRIPSAHYWHQSVWYCLPVSCCWLHWALYLWDRPSGSKHVTSLVSELIKIDPTCYYRIYPWRWILRIGQGDESHLPTACNPQGENPLARQKQRALPSCQEIWQDDDRNNEKMYQFVLALQTYAFEHAYQKVHELGFEENFSVP